MYIYGDSICMYVYVCMYVHYFVLRYIQPYTNLRIYIGLDCRQIFMDTHWSLLCRCTWIYELSYVVHVVHSVQGKTMEYDTYEETHFSYGKIT